MTKLIIIFKIIFFLFLFNKNLNAIEVKYIIENYDLENYNETSKKKDFNFIISKKKVIDLQNVEFKKNKYEYLYNNFSKNYVLEEKNKNYIYKIALYLDRNDFYIRTKDINEINYVKLYKFFFFKFSS
jgi:hypothetical protein